MTSAIIASENASSMQNPVRRIRLASSGLPSPMRMPSSGDAPHEIHTAAEPTIVTTGPQTPTPASAVSPTPAMWPMYILSTMLYSTLTNCASMLGSAVRQTSAPISSRPRSFSFFIVHSPLHFFRIFIIAFLFPFRNRAAPVFRCVRVFCVVFYILHNLLHPPFTFR